MRAYFVNQPQQTIPIFGASSPARIAESAKAVEVKPSMEELAELHIS